MSNNKIRREFVELEKDLLGNNVPLYMVNINKKISTIEVYLVAKVGSRNDPSMKMGIAHYLEHMLLAFDENMEEQHGNISNIWGYTNFEETVFHVTSLNEPEFIKKIIYLMYQIVVGDTLTPMKMEKVRKDIISEWNFQVKYNQWQAEKKKEIKSIKNKIKNLDNNNYEILVKGDAYKQRNIVFPYIKKMFDIKQDFPVGKLEDIEHISFKDIRLFHNKYYHERNISMIVVGNLKKASLFNLLEESIGVIRRAPIDGGVNLRKNYESINKNYMFRVYNQENRFQITLYFLKEYSNTTMFRGIEQSFLEKLSMLVLTQYLETELLLEGYRVSNSYTETTWIMKNNKLYTIRIEFDEFNQITIIEEKIKQLLKAYRLESLNQYEKRQLKRMMFTYLDQDIINCMVDKCIGEYIYNEPIRVSLKYYKVMKKMCNQLNQDKVNQFVRNLVKCCNIYMYCDSGGENESHPPIRPFKID